VKDAGQKMVSGGNGVLLGRRLKSVHQRRLVFQQIQGRQQMNVAWGRCAVRGWDAARFVVETGAGNEELIIA